MTMPSTMTERCIGHLSQIPNGEGRQFDVEGRLCSTLPTARPSGLPIHINAELYLQSDRRQPGRRAAVGQLRTA